MNLLINIFLIFILNFSVLIRPSFPLMDYLRSKEISSSSHCDLVQKLLEKAEKQNKDMSSTSRVNLPDAPMAVDQILIELNHDFSSISCGNPVVNQFKIYDLIFTFFQPPKI